MRVLVIGGTVFIGRAITAELAGAGHELRILHRGQHEPDDDEDLPLDLAMTGDVRQHLLVDSSKARRVLGFTDTDAAEALRVSVGWHLAHPPEQPDEDFTSDDRALAAASG